MAFPIPSRKSFMTSCCIMKKIPQQGQNLYYNSDSIQLKLLSYETSFTHHYG